MFKKYLYFALVLVGVLLNNGVNQITSIAQNFKIQYYKDGKWVDLDGVQQNQAPGCLAIIAAYNSKGYYCMLDIRWSQLRSNAFRDVLNKRGYDVQIFDPENKKRLT